MRAFRYLQLVSMATIGIAISVRPGASPRTRHSRLHWHAGD